MEEGQSSGRPRVSNRACFFGKHELRMYCGTVQALKRYLEGHVGCLTKLLFLITTDKFNDLTLSL
jgi:hypothetical protein